MSFNKIFAVDSTEVKGSTQHYVIARRLVLIMGMEHVTIDNRTAMISSSLDFCPPISFDSVMKISLVPFTTPAICMAFIPS